MFSPQKRIRSPLPYRDVCYRNGWLFAVGGNEPSSGSRSAYCAAAACWNAASGQQVWEQVITKSKPFTALAISPTQVIAVLPHNFVREPTGVVAFNAATGTQEHRLSLGADSAAVFSDGACLIGAHRGGVASLSTFASWEAPPVEIAVSNLPGYADKVLQRIAMLHDDTFVATFSFARGSRMVYAHELWSRAGAPLHTIVEGPHNRSAVNCEILATYSADSTSGTLTIYSLAKGHKLREIAPKLGPIQALSRGPANQFLACFQSGALALIDSDSGAVDIITHLTSSPVWRVLQYDAASHTLALMETGGHRDPHTEFSVFSLGQ